MSKVRLLALAFVAFTCSSLTALAESNANGAQPSSVCYYDHTECTSALCMGGHHGTHYYNCSDGTRRSVSTCCGAG